MALSSFEIERQARIARNQQRIADLELSQAAIEFTKCAERPNKRQRAPISRVPRQTGPRSLMEARRSGRLANQPAVEYNESNIEKADNPRSLRQFYASSEEVYTEGHIKLLGTFKEEWVLFEDGYDAQGNRIYNKETGLTCHQCRQKTLGLRTTCSSCQSLKGVFCGDCLFMRYGENVKEAAQNPDWVCPDCRGICNCSIHRIRKGWAPTGSLYRRAIADGYKSVAHMLILTNQAKDKPSKNASEAENAVSETEQVPDKNPPNKESISADDSQPTVVPEKKKKGNKSHGKDVALKEASKQETRSKELLLARSAGTEKPKEKERLPQTKPMTRRQSREEAPLPIADKIKKGHAKLDNVAKGPENDPQKSLAQPKIQKAKHKAPKSNIVKKIMKPRSRTTLSRVADNAIASRMTRSKAVQVCA